METVIFFALLIISGGSFGYEVGRRYLYTNLGQPEARSDQPLKRLIFVLGKLFYHERIMQKPLFGILHFFTLWGFLMLLGGTANMAAEYLFDSRVAFVADSPIYLMVKDVLVVLISLACVGFLLRRTIFQPKWLKNTPIVFVIIVLILVIAISETMFHGVQIVQGEGANLAWAAPVASAIAGWFANMELSSLGKWATLLFWSHFLAVFALFIIVPRSKHLHLVFAPFNLYWRKLGPKGALRKITLEAEGSAVYGAKNVEDFTSKQLLDAYACVKCGRCDEACPSHQSHEDHKPKRLNGRLRKQIDKRGHLLMKYRGLPEAARYEKATQEERKTLKKIISGDVFEADYIWACTTCGACVEVCPIFIEHTARIFEMRRYLVSAKQDVPEAVSQACVGIEHQGNPWGIEPTAIKDWLQELGAPTIEENPGAEWLYFVGCAGLYDEQARKTTMALVKLLKRAGVSFAIGGYDQRCCGDTVRRMGNERLYQKIVQDNIAEWNSKGVKKIITACPHCFNTLQNEYPQFGAAYEVVHHSVLLADLLKKGSLKPVKGFAKTITYHDPCYLGRYNHIFNEPREILTAIPGVRLLEMPRLRKHSFCCGAGGGRAWTKEKADNAITKNRTGEAIATGAEVVCTACSYCRSAFSADLQAQEQQNDIRVMDIAEILAMSLAEDEK